MVLSLLEGLQNRNILKPNIFNFFNCGFMIIKPMDKNRTVFLSPPSLAIEKM